MNPPFSIIVATYNKLDYLKKCVTALLALNYPEYEIIIINDCSSDGTKEYLDCVNNPRIKVIHNDANLGTCRARNLGIAAAQSPYLAFTDHDCCPHQEWLNELANAFKNESTAFVFGQIFYISENYHGYFPERLVKNYGARWPMGCNLAFRTDILKKLNGFNPKFFVYGNEDTELALNAVSHGYHYERTVNAIVYHQSINWTPRSLWCSARYASVWPLLKKQYPQHWRHFQPKITLNFIVNGEDYIYFLTLPLLLPILLVRYLLHGKRDLKTFFAKWPLWLFLRRYYLYREALRNRILMF